LDGEVKKMADEKLPPLGDKFLIMALYGGNDFGLDNDNPSGDAEDIPTVVEKVFADTALRKAGGTSSHDSSWDEPIGDAPAVSLPKDFIKSSDERFAKVATKIRELFGPLHMEEAEEAIEAAEEIRKAARAVVIAGAK
jgi:hypothetical protein